MVTTVPVVGDIASLSSVAAILVTVRTWTGLSNDAKPFPAALIVVPWKEKEATEPSKRAMRKEGVIEIMTNACKRKIGSKLLADLSFSSRWATQLLV